MLLLRTSRGHIVDINSRLHLLIICMLRNAHEYVKHGSEGTFYGYNKIVAGVLHFYSFPDLQNLRSALYFTKYCKPRIRELNRFNCSAIIGSPDNRVITPYV